jgi:hypothetical protein
MLFKLVFQFLSLKLFSLYGLDNLFFMYFDYLFFMYFDYLFFMYF